MRLRPNLDLYANPEIARGIAIANGHGLGGYLNGHFIPPGAYIARAFARWTVRTGGGDAPIEAGDNQIPMTAPARRLVVTAGKFSTNDFFDLNRYAVNPRTQFMNFALDNSTAWDYAQDVRGYTRGVIIEWIHPKWTLRAGSAQVPTTAGGPELAADLRHNRGDQVEVEFQPRVLGRGTEPAVMRLLAFRNLADMGNYRRSIRRSRATGQPPDNTVTRREGAATYGFNVNFEQPLADEGETGLFGRLGWNDGQNESWGYTECDRNASLGIQLAGARWRRADDRLGLGFGVNGLSGPHRRYLALGGLGFTLGDGALNYGLEQILEVYYACQLLKPLTLTLDYQYLWNPGYNQDRGPASALALRAHVNY